ncbi:MAG: phosphoribosylformylglycinamidine synthase subunit PurS [Solirubrobacteraceae bacterium]|jgi:phosphoribosylformylglycinamidine synthase subunit PurS
MRARVLVRPKQGILDPQGQAVERALAALGFEGVADVRIGRLIDLEIEDPRRLSAMCEQLLANPLIEDYEIVTEPAAERTHATPRPAAGGGASPAAQASAPAP